MRWRHILILAVLLFAGCKKEPVEPVPLDEAFVGPFELEILAELSPEAPVVALLSHGERVEIMERRRSFARIRAAAGVRGWTDGRMLLSASHMARLRHLSMNAVRLPSQGKATVYDDLNVHTDPNRQAPSFYRMREGNLVEVIAHQVLPRRPYQPPPEDDLSIVRLNSYDPPSVDPSSAGPVDGWSLVRLADGRAGWALSRMLVMAIPDEVAQYAEGHRITSYASLGRVEDEGQIKHNWLWTTQARGGRPYQFDGFRVFVWSTRRHRYETAYIERNVVGYYPVEVRLPSEEEKKERVLPEFTLILRDPDGRLYRRSYNFSGYRVRQIGKEPWDAPYSALKRTETEYVELPQIDSPSVFQRLVDRVIDFFAGDDAQTP